MPWIKEEWLYPVLILLLIFIMAARLPIDSDMWWHLRAGEETIRSGQVYRVDTFSSTRAGASWINHSWLSQVLMAGLLRIGNFAALSVWVAVCAVGSMALVYLRMDGHPLLRGAVLILAAMVSSVVWSPRPQIMSLVLLALICLLVERYREHHKKIILILIPLVFALWGNLHGGYVLGLIYLAGFLGGELLDRVLFREGSALLPWRELGLVGGAMVLGYVLVLVNPFGFEMWKLPFNTVGVETLQNLINEWASPDFHQIFQQPLLWMLLGLLGVVGFTGKPIRGSQLVPVAIFAYAALVARRNFGPFAIVCAPVLADQLSVLMSGWISRGREKLPIFAKFIRSAEGNKQNFNMTVRNITNLSLIVLLAFAAVLKVVQVNSEDVLAEAEAELYPVGAVAWLTEQDQPFRIFNEYNWGGYLIYRLPDTPVFVDGRTDLFGDEILDDYQLVMRAGNGWELIIDQYDLDLLLLREGARLSKIAIFQGWEIAYQDHISVLLQKSE